MSLKFTRPTHPQRKFLEGLFGFMLIGAIVSCLFLPASNANANPVTCENLASPVEELVDPSAIQNLAALKIASAKSLISDPNSLVNRTLVRDYERKYDEILAVMAAKQNNINLAKSKIDEILRAEINKLQAQNDATSLIESNDRQIENESFLDVFPDLVLKDSGVIPRISGRVDHSISTRGASQILNDGRLFLNYENRHTILNPTNGSIEVLPDGRHARVMPDGKSILIFKVQTAGLLGTARRRAWILHFYDLQAKSAVRTVRVPLFKYFPGSSAGSHFTAIAINPSGDKLALATVDKRLIIIDLRSGDVVNVVQPEDNEHRLAGVGDVFFIDDDVIQFLDKNGLCRHNLKTGRQSCVSLEMASPSFNSGVGLTSDGKNTLITNGENILTVEHVDDETVNISNVVFKKNATTSLLKSLPDDNQHYFAATTGKSTIGAQVEMGLYDRHHNLVFDFQEKYLDNNLIYDVLIGQRNRVIYVFYASHAERGTIKMDVWRAP